MSERTEMLKKQSEELDKEIEKQTIKIEKMFRDGIFKEGYEAGQRYLPESVEAVLEAARDVDKQNKAFYTPVLTQVHEMHMYDSLETLSEALANDKGRK